MPAAQENPRLYVIDTSSIIDPRRLLSSEPAAEKNRVYRELGALVKQGTLLFPHQVCEELKRFHDDDPEDRPYLWAHEHKDAANGGFGIADLFDAVRTVNAAVDNLIDYDKPSPGDDADPWVVGLALYLKQAGRTVSVITEDRNDRPEKTSMQSACGVLEISALSVRVFLRSLGIWPHR